MTAQGRDSIPAEAMLRRDRAEITTTVKLVLYDHLVPALWKLSVGLNLLARGEVVKAMHRGDPTLFVVV